MSENENNLEIMNAINELVNELTLSDENDDPDSREIDYPSNEEEELELEEEEELVLTDEEEEKENEEETEPDTSSMDTSDSSSDIDDGENDAEELPFPNLTIRIPTAEAEATSPHSPLYSPGTPETNEIPGDLAEDLAAEAHALETEEEAFGEASEEKIETKQEEKTPVVDDEKEPDTCGVCYVELNTKNVVNTSCNHQFCNKCFFKWIKVQARCPMCRKHFRTDVDLTDEEIARENSEIYNDYITNLEKYVSASVIANNEFEKVSQLRKERLSLLQSQISLREQIDQTRAYNDGVMAAIYEKNTTEIPRDIMLRYDVNKRLPDYVYGYRKGLRLERERLEKNVSKNIKIKSKKKKRQLDLFNFGFNVDTKVSKITPGQKNEEHVEFSFEFVPSDPNKPPPVFSFN